MAISFITKTGNLIYKYNKEAAFICNCFGANDTVFLDLFREAETFAQKKYKYCSRAYGIKSRAGSCPECRNYSTKVERELALKRLVSSLKCSLYQKRHDCFDSIDYLNGNYV